MLAVDGRLSELTPADEKVLFSRGRAADPGVEAAVRGIVAEVRARGDEALRELARRFDGVELEALEVPASACREALRALDPEVRAGLEAAARAIAAFHRAQLPAPLEVEPRPGVVLGRRAEPLGRVGVYAPGGRASYPSSVLMGVIPARVAGVGEVVVCSPPGPDGRPPAAVLAACALAGADRVFALGGAGAVAALACGTASVPRVDKIVGPGNAYVNEAKRQLVGVVGIDNPAGPSEVLVVADETADPELCAAELMAQAEHDPDAAVALVTTSPEAARRVRAVLERRVPESPRRAIIEAALSASGAVLVAESRGAMLDFATRYAPEHLILLVADPRAAMDGVRAAGTVFLGAPSSVAFGDYTTGANHVLPTNGLSRAYSGLSTLDFVRFFTYQELTPEAAAALSEPTAVLAEAEGLPAHARAARLRGNSRFTAEAQSAQRSSQRPKGSGGGDGPAGLDSGIPDFSADPAASESAEEEAPQIPDGTVSPRLCASAVKRNLFRPAYAAIDLYDPGRRPVEVDLSDNTNLFGLAPAAERVLSTMEAPAVTRYPSVFADRLKRALAELHGVEPENVATGCGSDDVIDSAMRAFVEPGETVAYPAPTFGVVPTFARMNAARPVAVPLAAGFELDAEALLSVPARATYLCRPNNPTGTLFERAAVERIARESAGVVLVDEAYADYAGEDMSPWAAGSERTLVLRTLSKAYSLAGLRVGYAVGPRELVREIEKSRGPYKVSGAAEAAALAVLAEDRGWVRGCIAQTVENRERLREALERLGLVVWPSAANFLLVEVPAPAQELNAALRGSGVAARPFPALPQAGECLRVSVGPWPMMERFVKAMESVLALGDRRSAIGYSRAPT